MGLISAAFQSILTELLAGLQYVPAMLVFLVMFHFGVQTHAYNIQWSSHHMRGSSMNVIQVTYFLIQKEMIVCLF